MSTLTLAGPLADRDAWSSVGRCSIGHALEAVGTRSTLLLLREALYGTTRFDDFARRVGISEAVAATRLKGMVAEGLFERVPYQEPGARTRHEYQLTEKGRDLYPVLLALLEWGDRWAAPDGALVTLRHAECGEPVRIEARCAAGHRVGIADVEVHARPRRRGREEQAAPEA